MIEITHTCIKEKSKGSYKRVKTATPSVVTEEKPNDNPTPINPEVETPDFEGYPQEIDYPDYGEDYECSESMFGANVRSVDFEIDNLELIVDRAKRDIASKQFLEKSKYYCELLKVDRAEFDDYLFYPFTPEEIEDIIKSGNDELLYNVEVEVNEFKVFERLFSLYCQDNAFVIPAKNPYLKTWLDRLETDGRYLPKKQLNIFGEV